MHTYTLSHINAHTRTHAHHSLLHTHTHAHTHTKHTHAYTQLTSLHFVSGSATHLSYNVYHRWQNRGVLGALAHKIYELLKNLGFNNRNTSC